MRMLLCCGSLAAALLAAPASAAVPLSAERQRSEASCVAGSGFHIGGGDIALSYDAAAFSLKREPICAWAVRAALAVKTYYGRFPVSQVRVVLKPQDGDGVRGGTTWGSVDDGKPLIEIRLGRHADAAQLDQDWTMTHEMVHLSIPSVPDQSHWLEEGIATYVEPIARVQTGELDAQRIWADMLHGMHKGLPRDGDRGLDNTPTWGRT